MPAELILAIVVAVFAIISWIIWRNIRNHTTTKTDRRSGDSFEVQTYANEAITSMKWITIGLAVLSAFLVLLSSIQVVGTKEVGVVTSFGQTDGHLGAGLGFTWPWENVTEMDGAIQTDKYQGNDAFTIRIANQQTAYPEVTIRWRIVPGQADNLFQNYRTFENVRDSLVTNELRTALGAQMAKYNPLDSVQYGVAAQGAQNPTYAELANRVRNQMRNEIGRQIEVLSIFMPFVGFDKETEAKLNALQQQIAQTRINVQLQQTNKALAKANDDLASSVAKAPNVLVAQCMGYLGELIKNGGSIPPGFSCWPGGGVAGVIANATGK